MIRGTRYLFGKEAWEFDRITEILKDVVERKGFQLFIPSSLSERETIYPIESEKTLNQMYIFKDKKGRDICLIPEVTAVVEKIYKEEWQSLPKPIKLYYLTRCYRYEKPQAGRYREFWQFGIEILGNKPGANKEAYDCLMDCIKAVGLREKDIIYKDAVKRGLNYYINDGFEIEVPTLGAQKQIAGGGKYESGIGWAIGVDRLLLALNYEK